MKRLYIISVILCLTLAEKTICQTSQNHSIPHATTFYWSFENRTQLLDRTHSYGDEYYDRGFRAVITPYTPREYVLDMYTYEYPFTDSYIWDKNLEGLRVNFGSYTKSELAVYNLLNKNIKLTNSSAINLTSVLQQDGRANRAFFEIRYNYTLLDKHTLSLSHTLTDQKQDLDLTLGYTYSDNSWGNFQLDITYQNYINNIVHQVGNDQGRRWQDFNDDIYKNMPLFIFTRYYSSPDRFWYLDISAGYQPEIKLEKKIFKEPEFLIEQSETIYFFNSSLSFQVWKTVLGGFIYHDHSDLSRSSPAKNPIDGFYDSNQKLSKAGIFGYLFLGRFQPHLRLSFEEYSDLQNGTDFNYSSIPELIDYKEQRVLFDIGSSFEIIKEKLSVLARYLSLDRNLVTDDQRIYSRHFRIEPYDDTDKRIALSFQITPGRNFFFELGASYDVDKDIRGSRKHLFDKGFGKLSIRF